MKFSDDEIKKSALGIKIFIATNIRIINHLARICVIFRKKLHIFFAKKFADKKKGCIFALAIERLHTLLVIAEIAQLVEHNLAKVGVASSSLVFRSKSKSFEDKIKQNPLKHRFRGFFICCRSVSLRHGGAPIRHSPNLEVSLRISTVKIRDTYSEMRGHFDIFRLSTNFSG